VGQLKSGTQLLICIGLTRFFTPRHSFLEWIDQSGAISSMNKFRLVNQLVNLHDV